VLSIEQRVKIVEERIMLTGLIAIVAAILSQ
jgi:hypothetical protein